MPIDNIFNQVTVLLLIMLTGFYAAKRNYLSDTVNKKLSELLLKVTNPLLVISSFQVVFRREILHDVLIVFLFALGAHAVSALLGLVLFKQFKAETRKVMKFSTIYSNCGFVGFPILESLFGSTGVLLGSVYVAVFNLFLWTNGVVIFDNKKQLGKASVVKAIINPGIVSVVIGLFMFSFSIQLPFAAAKAIQLVGSMTVPLSMLIVGANIASCNLKTIFRGLDLFFASFTRLILIPLLTFASLKLIGFSGMLLSTCVLLVAMPTAATTTIFAEMYRGDTAFASRVVAFTTIISILTIPFIILLCGL